MLRRQDDITQQLKVSLQAKINKKESLFSLDANESTDINDSAQLLILVVFLQALNCVRISFPWKHWLLAPVKKTYLLQLRMPAFALD